MVMFAGQCVICDGDVCRTVCDVMVMFAGQCVM